ncbi:MAG: LamG domain-containing protein [Opitutales bacterium]|nr:LamG domain-containing protein [Opitutales bacterium]
MEQGTPEYGGGGRHRGMYGNDFARLKRDQSIRWSNIDGGLGGAARIGIRYSQGFGNGDVRFIVNGVETILRMEGTVGGSAKWDWRWRFVDVELLAGAVNVIEFIPLKRDFMPDILTVASESDLAKAAPHRVFTTLSEEEQSQLLAFLQQLDGRDADGVIPADGVPAKPSVLAIDQTGLAIHLTFDDGAEDSQGNQSASLSGGAGVDTSAGAFGASVRFDGGDDMVHLLDSPVLNIPKEAVVQRTISLWFAVDDVDNPGRQQIFESGGSTRGFNAYIDNGTLYAGVWDQNIDVGVGDVASWEGTWRSISGIASGVWHHLALVIDASADPVRPHEGAFFAYLNGVEFDVGNSLAMQISRHGDDSALGGVAGASRWASGGRPLNLNGNIDDFAIWHRSLSEDEIRILADGAGGSPVDLLSSEELVGHFPFDEGWTDRSGIQNLRINGGALIEADAGQFMGGARFDGVDDVANIRNNNLLNTYDGGLAQRTISLWFSVDDVASMQRQVIFDLGGSKRGFNAYIEDGVLHAGIWDIATDAIIGDQETWPGTWRTVGGIEPGAYYHLLMVLDASESPTLPHPGAFKAYLNGVEFDVGNDIAMQIAAHTDACSLGGPAGKSKFLSGGTGSHFRGFLDDFAVWNRVLSDDEIARLSAP